MIVKNKMMKISVQTRARGDRARCSRPARRRSRRGTDEWNRVAVAAGHQRLARQRYEAAEQIEDDELDLAHTVFDVVAEDPEEEHVAGQVQEPAVHEHRRERGDEHRRLAVHLAACDPLALGDALLAGVLDLVGSSRSR